MNLLRDRKDINMKKKILFGAGAYGLEALEYFGRTNVYCFADLS